ncbi:hypothetical protein CHLNCDRAFT_145325 [Chlorella variabilis]|uniref:Chloride channel protein n=1 Tax=Chlorella variabilis TaxID=554065 RepID=E1ZE66_CHLVA|nr:hypothetical protein CHLNCDRAFT_145325 [Chlorella variabilis]EFN55978.1 hypothetical protein CHLNCDRAFT_145325 [Chlorella variabilis]|eukprot:XP_005848080.1 hypothetical protein CHLNCDRAFT_145325 [Chlorella variabilis]
MSEAKLQQEAEQSAAEQPGTPLAAAGSGATDPADAGHDDALDAPLFDPPFAPLKAPYVFWQDVALLSLTGGFMGVFGYSFLKAISEGTDAWMRADGNSGYPDDPSSLHFGAGRWWWILMVAGMGLAVGLVRAVVRLETAPSFIQELRSMHVDPKVAAKSTVITLISLLGAVPMGPEAGLGAAAGTVATLVCRRRSFRQQATLRRRLYVLSTMCSAFAAFLPSPFVAVLMTMELSQPFDTLGLTHVHLALVLTFGATASFAAYYGIAGYTYYSPAIFLTDIVSGSYDQMFIVQGALIGIGGAAFGVVYILFAGFVQVAVRAARAKLDTAVGRWPRVVVMATAGGAAIGALGWAMPLVLTDGSSQLPTVMRSGAEVGSGVLAASAFAKALAYHIAGECGFSGGIFLPMLSMSSLLGQVVVNSTGINAAMAQSCSAIALGAALIPAPFMLALLANSLALVGPQGLVPIFTTAATAHLLCIGIGVPQGLLARAAAQRAAKAAASAAAAATVNGQEVEP